MAYFDIGQTVLCEVDVKDDDGVLTDPATSMEIEIIELQPNPRVKVAYTAMTKDSTGKYHYDLDTSGCHKGVYEASYKATDGNRITIDKKEFNLR